MFDATDPDRQSGAPGSAASSARMKQAGYIVLVLAVGLGGYLAGTSGHPATAADKSTAKSSTILYYVDPMHPQYKSDKPGIAPDCGMDLEPVYADGAKPSSPAGMAAAGGIPVDGDKVQMTGIVSEEVRRAPFSHAIRTVGRVVADENKLVRVVAGSSGWVRKSVIKAPGTLVQKGELLATYYTRDVQVPEMSYIAAVQSKSRPPQQSQIPGPPVNNTIVQAQFEGARDNLLSLGVSETQLEDMARTMEPNLNIDLRAPGTGFVVSYNVFTGLRFERGTELARLVDLSHVWITADLFRNETANIRPGTSARVTIPEQHRTLNAKVAETLPQFDAATRSTRVRLELANPGLVLRPDMFVDVEFPVDLPATLHIPVDAVVGSGTAKSVYVERTPGVYDRRPVQTGWQFGDRVEIAGGLSEGEKVVRSGAFLLDSETRMTKKAAASESAVKDPVCGMAVSGTAHHVEYHGVSYRFCSPTCKSKFEADKDRYARPMKPL